MGKHKVTRQVVFYEEDHPDLLALWDSWAKASGVSASAMVRVAMKLVFLSGLSLDEVKARLDEPNVAVLDASSLRRIIREELANVSLANSVHTEQDVVLEHHLGGEQWEL